MVHERTVHQSTVHGRTVQQDPVADLTLTDHHYADGGTSLTGVLCRADGISVPRPAIFLVHGGAGLDEHARDQARRYAALGYVVLAGDMFGQGVRGDRDRTISCLLALRDDPDAIVRRAGAGLASLSRCPGTNGRVAVVGFCFGGLVALTLARAGVPVDGAVSIHGSLAATRQASPGSVQAPVLACHGALDPHVPLTDVTAFAAEMNGAGGDWQLIMYGGAEHGFTHARAAPGAQPGVAYDPVADRRSFAAVAAFLEEVFADRARPRSGRG